MENRMNAIVYHKADLDGVASAAIASRALRDGDNIEYFPYNYGMDTPDVRDCDDIYVLDVSFGDKTDEVFDRWTRMGKKVIWIDHHKSAIEVSRNDYPGIREIGKAACQLTWRYFHDSPEWTPILYLGVYDVWDHEALDWDDVIAFQYGMRARVGLCVGAMLVFMEDNMGRDANGTADLIREIISNGEAILAYISEKNGGELDNFHFEATIDNYRALCMNTTEFNSTTFESMWDENEFDVMMPFCYVGPTDKVRFSLYTTKDIDCSEMARALGGGGHAKAAGFHLSIDDFHDFLKTRELVTWKRKSDGNGRK